MSEGKGGDLEVQALAVVSGEKTKDEIIAFTALIFEGKICNETDKVKLKSELVKKFAKQTKTHFQEWKEKVQAVVEKVDVSEEEFAEALVFDKHLVMESDLHYARAIFKKEVTQDRVKGFFLDIAPFIQQATEEQYQQQSEDLTQLVKPFWAETQQEEDSKVKEWIKTAQEYLDRSYDQLKQGILNKDDYNEEIAELSMGIEELKAVAEKMLKKEINTKVEVREKLLEKSFELKNLNKNNKFAKEFIDENLEKLCKNFCSGD